MPGRARALISSVITEEKSSVVPGSKPSSVHKLAQPLEPPLPQVYMILKIKKNILIFFFSGSLGIRVSNKINNPGLETHSKEQ